MHFDDLRSEEHTSELQSLRHLVCRLLLEKKKGNVVRIYKDESQMDIRGTSPSGTVRKIAYDSSTQWTKGGKPGQQDEVKEGSFVIVLGKVDEKGVLHATRVDLRLPR